MRRINLYKDISHRDKLWIGYMILFGFIALLSPIIANDKPIFCKINDQIFFPAFSGIQINTFTAKHKINVQSWKEISFEKALWPPISYSSNSTDTNTGSFSPPSLKSPKEGYSPHILGTDAYSRDVFAGIISGTRIAFKVGLFSMIIASLVGIILGLFAGFFGDSLIRLNYGQFVLSSVNLIGFIYALYVLVQYHSVSASHPIVKFLYIIIIPLCIFSFIQWLIFKIGKFLPGKAKISVLVDFVIMRIIEWLKGIPNLFLLLACLPLFKNASIYNIIILIGFFTWPTIAIYVRSEVLRVRTEDYIKIARLNGINNWRLMWRHILPNAIQPALVTIAFGFASAILAEASLSFLGIGIPINEVTWGSLLTMARVQFSAWWLALFPGLAIFFTVICFNLFGDKIAQKLTK